MKRIICIVFAAASLSAAPVLSDSFESGCDAQTFGIAPAAPWTVGGGNPTNPAVYGSDDVFTPPRTGNCTLDLGPAGSHAANGGFAEIIIGGLISGDTYELSLWHRMEDLNTGFSTFRIDLSGANVASFNVNSPDSGYVQFLTSFVASGTSLTLRLTETGGPVDGYNSLVDDVLLDHITASEVPEPSTVFLLGAGLLAIGLRLRRR